MNKQFHIDECNRQLTDTKFYEKHDNYITNKVTRTVTRYLEQMKQNEDIDKDTYSYLLPKDPRCSRFYILPKIHKNRQTPPGRPIVSANGHPTERISEYVSNILNPLVLNYLPSSRTLHTSLTNFLHLIFSLTTLSLSLWTSPRSILISLTPKASRLPEGTPQQTYHTETTYRNHMQPHQHHFTEQQF